VDRTMGSARCARSANIYQESVRIALWRAAGLWHQVLKDGQCPLRARLTSVGFPLAISSSLALAALKSISFPAS
jgi:hypothetical protein